MLRHRINKLLNRRSEAPSPKPIYYHSRISSENSFFLALSIQQGCSHNYTWGVIQAGNLAKTLGVPRISVVEFGVAGGNGLVALEKISERVSAHYDVGIDVYGFDTGVGLPQPEDYRDLPDILCQGDFPMDVTMLRKHLTKAQLFLGLVEETITKFIQSSPAPVAFISFDMDFYSSTMQGFKLLEAADTVLLPRVYCFFDDIFACGDFNGERLAISDFNASHLTRKISHIYGLQYFLPNGIGNGMLWDKYHMAYIFDHVLYGKNLVGPRTMDLEPK
jgi:hypothetical protein